MLKGSSVPPFAAPAMALADFVSPAAGCTRRWALVRFLLLVAGCALPVAACGDMGRPGHMFEIVDEDGGVPVAVSSAIPKFDGELFVYEKLLVIRPDPGNAESLLYQPFSFTLGDDGNYYVSDRGNHRVAVFDGEGDFVRAFGREGDGPGELRSPLLVEVRGDAVLVFDNRTTIFRRDGTLIDVLSSPAGRYPHPTRDGSLFVQGNIRSTREGMNYFGARGQVINETGEVVASVETPQVRMDSMLAYNGAPSVMLTPAEEIVATTGAEPVIDWYGLDGRLLRRARIDLPPEPVTEADQAAVERLWDERIEREKRSGGAEVVPAELLLHLKEGVLYPETKAFWERPIIDDAGWLWLPVSVADTGLATIGQAPVETRPRFRIVDSHGEYIGMTDWPEEALTPRGTTIIRGYLLTMVWDELADEMLPTVYRIRPAAEGLTYPADGR
jgi:hypothetical protein